MRKIVLALPVASMVMAAAAMAASTPAVRTGTATSIKNGSAILHAGVNPGGTSTRFAFQYGLTSAYGTQTKAGPAGHGAKAIVVDTKIAGLNPGTTYHYRVVATNKLGSTFGRDRAFETTGTPLAGAITGLPSAIGTTTATLAGTVITQGQNTSFIFEYGASTAYGFQTTNEIATGSPLPTAASATLSNLTPGTTYHFRLVANHAGTHPEDGLDQTFTTLPVKPLASTIKAHTTPAHARHKPYLFTTIGKVVPPSSLPAGVACTGFVKVRFLHGHQSVAVSRVPLQADCTFSTQVLFRHLVHHRKARLRVVTRFAGNSYLASAHTKGQKIRLG